MSVALVRTRSRRPRALPAGVAAGVGAGCIGLVVLGIGLAVVTGDGLGRLADEFALGDAIVAVSFATVGATVAARRPGHGVGLLLLGTGVVAAASFTSTRYAVYAYGPADAPLGAAAGWLASWVWFIHYPLLVLLLLVFPTGHPLGRGWRVLGWATAVHGLVGSVLLATAEQTVAAGLPAEYRNPLAVDGIAFDQWVLDILLVLLLLAAAAVVVRFRRAGSQERRQLGWFGYAAVLAVLAYLLAVNLDAAALGFSISWPLVAVAAGLTVLRRRLYGVDVAVSRSLVGAVLVLFVSAGWVVAASVVGALVGRDRSDLLPSVAATALVVMAAEPVRRATGRWADRMVRGRRAEPYRVLAAFAQQADTASPDDVLLAETARLVAAALGAREATVWLRDGGLLRVAAGHPVPPGREAVGLAGDVLPPLPGADRVAAVRLHGELLGALSVTLRRGAEPSTVDDELLADLAAHAALVLAGQRTRAELEGSRRRLVAAQHEERRRIERDLHDGAQQRLIALKVSLGVASAAARRRSDDQLSGVLDELGVEVDTAVTELRALIAGVYPEALTAGGIGTAVRAAARDSRLPVKVTDRLSYRYPPDVEAAVFFCCLEAVQNAVKHSGASQVEVEVGDPDGGLEFVVRDAGRGFTSARPAGHGLGLGNIADRVEALGGSVEVCSLVGRGTTVAGRIPAMPAPDR